MSGHSKWATTKRQKAIIDNKRATTFTKVARLITVAAREGGGDPNFNFKLRLAIDQAKAVNMPKDNIERAISRGVGGGESANLKEMIYEGFGPGNTAIVVVAYSDNPNRTASEVKQIFIKNGGNLGTPGSVMWNFNKLGVIRIKRQDTSDKEEELELILIEAGAEDIKRENDEIIIYTKVENLRETKEAIDLMGEADVALKIESAAIEYAPKETIELSQADYERLARLSDALLESDDVSDVFTNME